MRPRAPRLEGDLVVSVRSSRRGVRRRVVAPLMIAVAFFLGIGGCGGLGTLEWGNDEWEEDEDDDSHAYLPTGLRAFRLASGGVHLWWNEDQGPSREGIKRYVVYRDGEDIGTFQRGQAEEPGAPRGTASSYRVAAVDEGGSVGALSEAFELDPWWASSIAVDEIDPATRWTLGVAIDAAGVVHIAYVDSRLGAVRHATRTGCAWTVETAGLFAETPNDYGTYSTLRLAIGPDGSAHIAYVDTQEWQVVHLTRATGDTTWTRTVVHAELSPLLSAPALSRFCSLALDRSGSPVIGYATSGEARVAARTVAGWTTAPLRTYDLAAVDTCGLASAPDGSMRACLAREDGGVDYAMRGREAWVCEEVSRGVSPLGFLCHEVSVFGTSFVALPGTLGVRSGGAWRFEWLAGDEPYALACDAAGEPRIVGMAESGKAFVHAARTEGRWTCVTLQRYADEPSAGITVDAAGHSHVAFIQGGTLWYATDR